MEERQGLLKWTPSAVEREDARAPFGSTFSFDDEEAPPPPQRRAPQAHQAPVDPERLRKWDFVRDGSLRDPISKGLHQTLARCFRHTCSVYPPPQ